MMRRCVTCGFTRRYKTPDLAKYHFPKHSCARQIVRTERATRVAQRLASRGGVVRDCQCKIANHQHGTRLAYVIDKCRCLPCLDASIAWERSRRRDRLYGRSTGRVPAEPVRAHIRELMAAGMSYKNTAKVAGVALTTVTQLLYGRPDRRDHKPPYTCAADFAEKVLAVQVDPWLMTDGSRVDATGSHRRVQALVTQGWSQSQLCQRIGVNRANWFKMMEAAQISAGRARAIRDLYEQLWNVAPPQSNQRERIAYTRSRKHAAVNGWLPPLAWDDDTIDLPGPPQELEVAEGFDEILVERLMQGTLVLPDKSRAPELLEAIRRLAGFGLNDTQIAERIGRNKSAVTQQRLRNNIPAGVPIGGATGSAIATIADRSGTSAGGTAEQPRRHPAA